MNIHRILILCTVFLCFEGMILTADDSVSGPCDPVDSAAEAAATPRSVFDGFNRNPARIYLYGWLQTGIMVNEYGKICRVDIGPPGRLASLLFETNKWTAYNLLQLHLLFHSTNRA